MFDPDRNSAIIGAIILALGAIMAALITGFFSQRSNKPQEPTGGRNKPPVISPTPHPGGGSPTGPSTNPGGNVKPGDSLEPLNEDDRTLQQLKNGLEQGNQYCKGVRFPDRHVVKYLEGYYWVIDIRDAYTGEILQFKTGEYTIDDFDKRFRDSLADFTGRVLRGLIPDNIKYRIFIKGGADILGHNTFRRGFAPPYVFNDVEVYRKVDGISKYRYMQKYITHHIDEPIKNSDLPNLRARFLQLKLAEVYPELQGATILDGDVETQLGQEYRNAMLLLFVDWPEK